MIHFGLVLALQTILPPVFRDDWLLRTRNAKSTAQIDDERHEARLANGLIERVIRLAPDAATIRIENRTTGASMLRAVEPEASLELDGQRVQVGGLEGQTDRAYLTASWLDALTPNADALHFQRATVGATEAPFAWKRVRWCEDRPWPPPGASLTLEFAANDGASAKLASLRGLVVAVHYEIYDDLPVIAKWLDITNGTGRAIRLDDYVAERLALVEAESIVDDAKDQALPAVTVLSDLAMHGMDPKSSRQTTRWVADPRYTTQVNYSLAAPMLVESRPPLGPGVVLAQGEKFTTFRTIELFHDSSDRERQGLALRRTFRALAPWCTENPLMMHARDASPEALKLAIDQAADVGFEMVIQSFGSGFDIENTQPDSIALEKKLAEYAHAKGVELGGYSLLSSRSISPAMDVIDPKTMKPGGAIFGSAPCLGSSWGIAYFAKLRAFFEATGMDVLEHDGSYPGDPCASTEHPGHVGLADSQWRQWTTIRDFYRWCRGRGVFLNVPDFYFLCGSNKTGMGYRETNWSLPREQQMVHARQNIFDGTWTKTPSMGWMFVPLTEYQGGGAAATIEPLKEHLAAYEQHLQWSLGLGVQACWRGPRLFDSAETRALVARWVDFYKRHRDILDSDLIHLRRADGCDLDSMLHVNPSLERRGLLVVYNPLEREVSKTMRVPLYYTGLTAKASIREQDGEPKVHELDRAYAVELEVKVPARGMNWFVIE